MRKNKQQIVQEVLKKLHAKGLLDETKVKQFVKSSLKEGLLAPSGDYDTKSEEFKKGKSDYYQHVSYEDCPYAKASSVELWKAGWRRGQTLDSDTEESDRGYIAQKQRKMNESIGEGENGYIAFFNGKKAEIKADSLYQAKLTAIAHFKPRKSQEHMVSVVLAEKGGEQVTHVPDF